MVIFRFKEEFWHIYITTDFSVELLVWFGILFTQVNKCECLDIDWLEMQDQTKYLYFGNRQKD